MTWACEVCGASFTRRGTRPYRFCSVACRSAGQRPERPSPEQLKDWYVIQGLTANDIARMVGRDPKTTWLWLRQAGIETRPRGSNQAQHFKPGQPSTFAGRSHTQANRERFRADRLADGRVPYLKDGVHWRTGQPAETHPNWKGGITPERQAFYQSREWKDACKAVWHRADAYCERCGLDYRTVRRQRGPKFHVHHIVSFAVRELRAVVSNLVLLCPACHRWVHSNANTGREFLAPADGVAYVASAAAEASTPTLFDLLGEAS